MKKLKKWQIAVIIIIIALVIIGNILGGGSDSEETKDTPLAIEWNDEEQKGYVEFDQELEKGYVKDWVVLHYYENIAKQLESVDKDSLKDYEYIEFKANLKNEEGKIDGVIKGDLSVDFIKNYEDFSTTTAQLDVEDNIENLFLPKFLR